MGDTALINLLFNSMSVGVFVVLLVIAKCLIDIKWRLKGIEHLVNEMLDKGDFRRG